jgi:hypothetical protein
MTEILEGLDELSKELSSTDLNQLNAGDGDGDGDGDGVSRGVRDMWEKLVKLTELVRLVANQVEPSPKLYDYWTNYESAEEEDDEDLEDSPV